MLSFSSLRSLDISCLGPWRMTSMYEDILQRHSASHAHPWHGHAWWPRACLWLHPYWSCQLTYKFTVALPLCLCCISDSHVHRAVGMHMTDLVTLISRLHSVAYFIHLLSKATLDYAMSACCVRFMSQTSFNQQFCSAFERVADRTFLWHPPLLAINLSVQRRRSALHHQVVLHSS